MAQPQPSRMINPYAAAPAPAAAPKQWGVIDNMWGDLAVSSIPIAGSVYLGNRAVQDFRQGNWGSGIGNALWAGLGLIPGVGAVKGVLGAAKAGFKGLSAARAAGNIAKAGWRGATSSPLGMKSMIGATAAGMAAPALLDPAKPDTNAYQTPTTGYRYTPVGRIPGDRLRNLHQTMVNSVATNGGAPPLA